MRVRRQTAGAGPVRLALSVFLFGFGMPVLAQEADADLTFRYRYESVDDDALSKDAEASTLRSRLSLSSGRVGNFGAFAEFDDVREVGPDNYNAGAGNTPSRSQYPVVADPEGTEVNQVYVEYEQEEWRVRVGRQRVNFDNQRFVGGVGWRQNEQTYDAVRLGYKHIHFNADYVYVYKVRRIFGDDVSAGTHDQDGTHLLNLNASVDGLGKVSAYYYLLDNEDAAAFSTSTLGARLTGKRVLKQTQGGDVNLRYAAEFARQSDAGDNPAGYSASYWNLDAGVLFDVWDLGVGWEVLDGDEDRAGEAYRTPLATLHAFNGWADRFLATPNAGLDDKYVKAKFSQGNATAQLRYHRFEAADGGDDFGNEVDFLVGYKFHKYLRVDLKYADFNGDGAVEDVSKLWLMVSVNVNI